ncbi:efflux RND transporter permease subunit [Rhizomicrobium electricum]|uniref:CusA/CzcA family heavy metal efflux RND transporter n=1 Tax=Rhizomicrobium electricum TaxID=480070 RepID=A0ABN1EVY7_9PROT|nr:CusA/CzcA family heavy metal efflux RND transporter [Rhizomicrobium electricum]NIJ50060.1 Cu(I)/Ag(I) efflux system membrane protein CusA/SilA [Rhizomicrobium electricum]
MIARIIRWSAQHWAAVLVATAVVVLAGIWAVSRIPLDAIPDLSDTQVIVYADYPGQAPQVVEDQVTFPLTSALLSVPKAKTVRGVSFFGVSFIYVIFEEGTDIYWARSRVLEYLNGAAQKLPQGVTPSLGPDATGVGWVYEYALTGNKQDLAQLRSLQDWHLRYALAKTEGVAEVASVGGFVKQYAVVADPGKMRSYGITLAQIRSAVAGANADVGGRTLELSETEFMIRGRGYLKSQADLDRIVLKAQNGTPVYLSAVAHMEEVPDERRGLTELNGEGEVASGIVVQRYGANALDVIHAVKARIAEITASLPDGVKLIPVYDRSQLIERAIATLKSTLFEESVIVALVCFLFLMHVRSALVAIFTLPVGILIAFIAMHALGLGSNIMSLGGIAIAIGAMVDAAIVMIENAHKRLERAAPDEPRTKVLIAAAIEVGPALFFSLLVITVSFIPIFALEEQEGRLFHPLAFTKSFAMAAAALLSVTLVPALMALFVRGKIAPEAKNPVNRFLIRVYRPVIALVLRRPWATIGVAAAVLAVSLYPVLRVGSEFMPTLNEGTLLYMPSTLPGLSVTKAAQILQTQDRIIKSFPEVDSVWGKAGRAETATDPAPVEMFETVINLKPQEQWRAGMTTDKLIADLDKALQFPGISNAWTMPIKARTDMLSTGIRTPVGIKIYGKDLAEIERLGREIEAAVHAVPGTTSAYAERINGGYYLNIAPDRDQIARYGLSIDDVLATVSGAVGAEMVTTTVEGRERYGVVVRYPRDVRSSPEELAANTLVSLPDGGAVPLGEVAKISRDRGPTMVRTEDGQLVNYVYVDFHNRDLGGFVDDAKRAVAERVHFPPGYYVRWSGQFEYMERANQRLRIVVPATLGLILFLLWLNFRRISDTLIVMLSLPFALVGGFWLMWAMGFNLSVAAAVGFIALAGVAAETGVVMLIYLNHAWEEERAKAAAENRSATTADLMRAVMTGAVDRVRPKMMTVAAIMAGLVPILWSRGTGSEIMQRIAVPMIGGMVSSTVLTLAVIPALFLLVHGRFGRRD